MVVAAVRQRQWWLSVSSTVAVGSTAVASAVRWQQRQCGSSTLAAARQLWAVRRRCQQRGGRAAAARQRWRQWQHASGCQLGGRAAVWRHHGASDGSSAAEAGLPLHAPTVAMKTPVATAMVRAQTTINNQLKAMAAMATETATTTTIKNNNQQPTESGSSNGNRNGDNDNN